MRVTDVHPVPLRHVVGRDPGVGQTTGDTDDLQAVGLAGPTVPGQARSRGLVGRKSRSKSLAGS